MPTYRITMQKLSDPSAANRTLRSEGSSADYKVSTVAADDIYAAAALAEAESILSKGTPRPRVVSIEEIAAIDAPSIPDDQLIDALTRPGSPLDLEGISEADPSDDATFPELLDDIASALRESLVPGLALSLPPGLDGDIDYLMIEIHDQATGTYRSVGMKPERLILDAGLRGVPAVLSIARALIKVVSNTGLL